MTDEFVWSERVCFGMESNWIDLLRDLQSKWTASPLETQVNFIDVLFENGEEGGYYDKAPSPPGLRA